MDGAIDINSADRVTGNTALHIAVHRGDAYGLQILLTEGDADITVKNEKDWRNVFHYAVSYSDGVTKIPDISQKKTNVLDTLAFYLGLLLRFSNLPSGFFAHLPFRSIRRS